MNKFIIYLGGVVLSSYYTTAIVKEVTERGDELGQLEMLPLILTVIIIASGIYGIFALLTKAIKKAITSYLK